MDRDTLNDRFGFDDGFEPSTNTRTYRRAGRKRRAAKPLRDQFDMPYRRRRAAPRRRALARKPARTSRYRTGVARVPRGIPVGPAPQHSKRQMVTSYDFVRNVPVGRWSWTEVVGNSMYKPIRTKHFEQGNTDDAAGHHGVGDTLATGAGTNPPSGPDSAQPYGFDELEMFYEQYQVTGCKLEIECYMLSDDASGYPVQLSVFTDQQTYPNENGREAVPIGTELLRESKKAVQKLLLPNTGGKMTRLTMYKSTKQVLGPHGKGDVTSKTSHGTNGADEPNDIWSFYIVTDTAAGQAQDTSTDIFFRLKITHYAHFFDRKFLAQSTE